MLGHVVKRGAMALLLAGALTGTDAVARAAAPIPPSIQIQATVYTLHHSGTIYTSVTLTPLTPCSQSCVFSVSILSPKIAWTTYACMQVIGASEMHGDWQIHQVGPYTYTIKTGKLGGVTGCENVTYELNTHVGTIQTVSNT